MGSCKLINQRSQEKWKKQENISNAEAAELMKAKNSQRERELVKPPAIQPPTALGKPPVPGQVAGQ